jgi:phosphoglycolate phosphatase-like HAD superfamily hydrolase
MRRYRHVAFDFDGVICDSLSAAIAVFNQLREESFPALPEVADQDDMVEVYGGSLRTSLSAWLDPAEHQRFFDLHSAAMAERAGKLRAFEGIDAMLDELPPESTSIITSAYSKAVTQVLVGGDGELPPSLFEIVGRERRRTRPRS